MANNHTVRTTRDTRYSEITSRATEEVGEAMSFARANMLDAIPTEKKRERRKCLNSVMRFTLSQKRSWYLDHFFWRRRMYEFTVMSVTKPTKNKRNFLTIVCTPNH